MEPFEIPPAVVETVACGGVVQLHQGGAFCAIVDADRLRNFLAEALPANLQWFREGDADAAVLPVLNLAAEASDPDMVLEQVLTALREYAEDWVDHLRQAPNHADNWPRVQLIQLCDDTQLSNWLNTPAVSVPRGSEAH